MISEKFGNRFSYDVVDVIKMKPLAVQPFDLKNKSLIFTSVNAVDSFFNNGFKPNEDFTDKNYNRIYCVGPKTKRKLRQYGFGSFKMKRHAQELSEFIIENSAKEHFLHFCGNLALDVLNKTLPLQNISYKKVFMYETELLYPKVETSYDAVAFFSPSGVRSFVRHNSIEGKKLFSLGHTTTLELRKHTKDKIYTSTESHFEDLLETIIHHD